MEQIVHSGHHHNFIERQDKHSAFGFKRDFSVRLILIIAICLIASVSVGIRTYYVEPISDDLLYQYVLDANPLGSNDYTVLVSGWADAIRSQATQYFYSNGRTLVHILVQMFAGPWGQTEYSIFLGCLLLAIIILFNFYTTSKTTRINPLNWLLIAVVYLYLFQNNSKVWYPIAGGMNYLFPMSLILSFLILFQLSTITQKNPNIFYLISLVLFGFITGWSQECFSLPLSGGIFIFAIRNWKKIKASGWFLIISLWIGTAILVFAPGNFVRLGTRPELIWCIRSGINLLIGTYLFWIMLIGLLILRITNVSRFKDFVRQNQLECYILTIAIAFGMVANTLPQSFNGISFYSAILLFKLLQYFPINSIKRGFLYTFVIVGLLIVGFHQYRMISSQRELKRVYQNFIKEYISSSNGILSIPDIRIPSDVVPFIFNWFTSSTRDSWLMKTLNWHYMKGEKPITLLDSSDYMAYSNSMGFLSKCKPILDYKNLYQGEKYLWFDSIAPSKGDTIIITQSLSHSKISLLYYKITGRPCLDYNQVIIPVDSTTMITSPNGLVGVEIGSRKLKDIEIRKKQ